MKNGAISRLVLVLVIVAIVAIAGNVFFLLRDVGSPATPQPKQAPQTLQKFRVSAYSDVSAVVFIPIDVGREQGIWASYGLDPEWVTIPNRATLAADLGGHLASGSQIGISIAAEVLLARNGGTPIKVVAAFNGELYTNVYVKADGPIRTINDLDGKKIGVYSPSQTFHRQATYLSNKIGIKTELINVGNATANQVAALKLGRVDAIINGDGALLRLVDSGELRSLLQMSEILPKPFATFVLYASDDLIQQNPDLVRRFVKAWLQAVRHIKENPSYAAEFYMRRANAPRDLADKVVNQITWTPSGRGSGNDLISAVSNNWQYNKDSGAVPANFNVKIQDAVDLRFLP